MSVSEKAACEWEPRSNPAAACCALSRFVSSQPWDFWMKNCFNTAGVIVKAAHSKELWSRRGAEEVYRKPVLPHWPNQAPLIRECDSGKTIDSSCCDALLISSFLRRRYKLVKTCAFLPQLLYPVSQTRERERELNEGCSGSHRFALGRGYQGSERRASILITIIPRDKDWRRLTLIINSHCYRWREELFSGVSLKRRRCRSGTGNKVEIAFQEGPHGWNFILRFAKTWVCY